MRYIIIPLTVILYLIWSYYSIKDILKYKYSWNTLTYIWGIITICLIISLIVNFAIPFVINNW